MTPKSLCHKCQQDRGWCTCLRCPWDSSVQRDRWGAQWCPWHSRTRRGRNTCDSGTDCSFPHLAGPGTLLKADVVPSFPFFILFLVWWSFLKHSASSLHGGVQDTHWIFTSNFPDLQTIFPDQVMASSLGDSGRVVNSLDFCLASLKSLGCFYFRCILSSQWKVVTVNLQIVHCQL